MQVTAAQVKELRERTGAGMMECKKALIAAKGDLALAVEELRKSGIAKADKKSNRIAAEGAIIMRTSDDGKQAAMVELNSETDFVARDDNFLAFADALTNKVLSAKLKDVSELADNSLAGQDKKIEESRQELVVKVGENINIRRLVYSSSEFPIGTYLHGNRIGVLVELDVDNKDLAKDVAMHVAASKPLVISQDEVSESIVNNEKEIFMAQAASSGKPQEIIEKMVVGRIKKFLDEVSLLGQPYVKDPSMNVASLLTKHRAKVVSFTRFEVGEGVEKEKEDFVEAVMSQVQGS